MSTLQLILLVVVAAIAAIPPVITRGLQVSGGFIVVVGYAMVINNIWIICSRYFRSCLRNTTITLSLTYNLR